MLNNSLRDFFAERSDYFHLTINNPGDISVTSYAVDQNEYGTINLLIGDLTGYAYLLTANRDESANLVFIDDMLRLSALVNSPRYNHLKSKIVTAEILNTGTERYACYKYLPTDNSHWLIWNSILPNNNTKKLDAVLGFCEELHESGNCDISLRYQFEHISDGFTKSYSNIQYIMEIANYYINKVRNERWTGITTIVHNDLIPINILMNEGVIRVVDWKYWEDSLSIFNFFEVLIAFGSLFTHSRYKSRDNKFLPANFRSFFTSDTSSKRSNFLKQCSEYWAGMDFMNDYPSEIVEGLFFFYLMSKSVCQFNKYKTHYASDLVWYDLLNAFCSERSHFRVFWEQMRMPASHPSTNAM